MAITVGSLFSGIGGIDYAFREAHFEIKWQVEIDAFCRQVLAKHFPDTVRHADIYDCHDLPHVDVLTAGFPCQPFSLAGKRLGEQDERYLIPEMFRVIQEVKPHVILFENVPGFASITDGSTFRDFLRALAAIGFDAEWTHLRAADAGAPHQRERWFCIAYMVNAPQHFSSHITEGNEGKREQTIVAATGERHGSQSIRRATLAYARSIRRGQRINHRSERQLLHNIHGDASQGQPERQGRKRGAGSVSQNRVGNAKRSRCNRVTRRRSIAKSANRHARHGRQLERGLGRDAYGLPARLDRHQFPAPPGAAQHPAEPPRVTTHAQDRAKRLKALGNAVVPQCVYPIALAIREWFEAQAAESAA